MNPISAERPPEPPPGTRPRRARLVLEGVAGESRRRPLAPTHPGATRGGSQGGANGCGCAAGAPGERPAPFL